MANTTEYCQSVKFVWAFDAKHAAERLRLLAEHGVDEGVFSDVDDALAKKPGHSSAFHLYRVEIWLHVRKLC